MIFNLLNSKYCLGIGFFLVMSFKTINSEYMNKGYELVKNIGFKVSWKLLELTTLINEFYIKRVRPKFHELTDNYFRKSIKVIKN